MFDRRPKSLRVYLKRAKLPPMHLGGNAPNVPQEGHKSHIPLTVRRERYRKLEIIRHIKTEFLDKKTIDFCKTTIAIQPCQTGHETPGDSNEKLTIFVNGFNIPKTLILSFPTDISRVGAWLDTYPLATIQHIMHMQYPRTSDWKIEHDTICPDNAELLRSFSWRCPCPDGCDEGHEHGQTSLVIVYQPPWVLSKADLKSFCDTDSLPSYEKKQAKMHSKHRLWARIWDICWSKQSPYFVLTSYDEWVVGMFSDGWSAAFVSKPLGKESGPSILQSLLYWFASSMHQPGGWIPHDIPEMAPLLETTTPADSPLLRDDESLRVPSWMRTSASSRSISHRRLLQSIASLSSASSMCEGLPEPEFIGPIRSERTHIRRALPIMPPRRSPSPPADSKTLYTPIQLRRPHPEFAMKGQKGQHGDIPKAFCTVGNAARLYNAPNLRVVPITMGEEELLPIACSKGSETPVAGPSKQRIPVAQSSVLPCAAEGSDMDARLSNWLDNVSSRPLSEGFVSLKHEAREGSPALSNVSSAATTVVDMIPNPETAAHAWSGGWIVRAPRNYRACP